MFLDAAHEHSLRNLKGRLEAIQSAWMLARTTETRSELNDDFKRLVGEITREHGAEGEKAVLAVVAKPMQLQHPRN